MSATYPVATIAKLLMLTERRVQQLAAEGVIPRAEKGRYELAPAVQGYIKFLHDRMHGNNSQVADLDYHAEKARKTKAEADLVELTAAKRKGELIEAADVDREAQAVMLQIRARMLAVPDRVTPRVVGETDERAVKAAIADEIEQALTALSESAAGDEDDDDGAEDADEDE